MVAALLGSVPFGFFDSPAFSPLTAIISVQGRTRGFAHMCVAMDLHFLALRLASFLPWGSSALVNGCAHPGVSGSGLGSGSYWLE